MAKANKKEWVVKWDQKLGGYAVQSSRGRFTYLTPEEFCKRWNSGENLGYVWNPGAADGKVIVSDGVMEKDDTSDNIPAGIFNLIRMGDTSVLKPLELEGDDYVGMEDSLTDVIKEMEWFLQAKEAYHKLGLAWRRGMLLYGPPGNGKTRTLMEAAKLYAGKSRIIVVKEIQMLRNFRSLLEDMPSIVILEELTENINDYGAQDVLNFLDGVDAWDSCFNIATTNYPEKLDANIVDRPSRFDKIIEIGNPNELSRKRYFSKFLSEDEITPEVLKGTEGMSIAYLKEFIIQRKLAGKSIESIITDYNERKKIIKKAFAKGGSLGFDAY